jgi:hypothetical protein
MAIEIEEIKQAAKEVKDIFADTQEVVVQKSEPFINWENVVNSIDQSHLIIAIVIFLIAVLAKPILALGKYVIIFGLIMYAVQHFAA